MLYYVRKNLYEIYRILMPGGLFITQQVGEVNDRELIELLLPKTPKAFSGMNLKEQVSRFIEAGFEIDIQKEAFRPMRFYDTGALIWFAKVIPWEFIDFTVAGCLDNLFRVEEMIKEETVKLIQHPLDVVQAWYDKYKLAKKSNISVCGTDCSKCYCYGKMCNGCNACEGKVFHASDGKACAIYECAKHKNNFEHCGNCNNAPCEIWMRTRDPKFSDEEFEENVKTRMDTLKGLKDI